VDLVTSHNFITYNFTPKTRSTVVRSNSPLHLGRNAPCSWTERLVICQSGSKPEFFGIVAPNRPLVTSVQNQSGAKNFQVQNRKLRQLTVGGIKSTICNFLLAFRLW